MPFFSMVGSLKMFENEHSGEMSHHSRGLPESYSYDFEFVIFNVLTKTLRTFLSNPSESIHIILYSTLNITICVIMRVHIWCSVAHPPPPPVDGSWSPPPPCGCGAVVGLCLFLMLLTFFGF